MKKVLVCDKIYSGKKNYKNCYLHNDHKLKPLHIMLPKTRACVQRMYFLIKYDVLLGKYNTICDNVKAMN